MAYIRSAYKPTVATYDSWGGGQDRNDYVEVAPGLWAISGSGEAAGYDAHEEIVDEGEWGRRQSALREQHYLDMNSPHNNAELAAQYVKDHPENIGGKFKSNEDIARLAGSAAGGPAAGMFDESHWDYSPPTAEWAKKPKPGYSSANQAARAFGFTEAGYDVGR